MLECFQAGQRRPVGKRLDLRWCGPPHYDHQGCIFFVGRPCELYEAVHLKLCPSSAVSAYPAIAKIGRAGEKRNGAPLDQTKQLRVVTAGALDGASVVANAEDVDGVGVHGFAAWPRCGVGRRGPFYV
jgi:hypothetical protein